MTDPRSFLTMPEDVGHFEEILVRHGGYVLKVSPSEMMHGMEVVEYVSAPDHDACFDEVDREIPIRFPPAEAFPEEYGLVMA